MLVCKNKQIHKIFVGGKRNKPEVLTECGVIIVSNVVGKLVTLKQSVRPLGLLFLGE